MSTVIDYNRAVDTLDDGILALNLYKVNREFPSVLREEIIRILNFLKLADKPDYKELLFDNHIAISKDSLDSIHQKIKDISFPVDDIEIAIDLLSKTSMIGGINLEEIGKLERYLLKLSNPIWATTISKKQYGE